MTPEESSTSMVEDIEAAKAYVLEDPYGSESLEVNPLEVKANRAPIFRPTIPQSRRLPRPGRNDPCWCGSGRKFKKCCRI